MDGRADEWAGIESNYLDAATAQYVGGTPSGPADISATLRCGWDAQAIYFFFDVSDDSIIADSSNIWDDDGVEIALDGSRDRSCCSADDHQFSFAVDGRIADFSTVQANPAARAAVVRRAGGYSIEAAVPANLVLSSAPMVGIVTGFDWGLNDDDDGSRRDKHLLWAGATILSYAQFGDLLLAPAAPGGANTPTPLPTATGAPSSTPTIPPAATATATVPAPATATLTATSTATPASTPSATATATPPAPTATPTAAGTPSAEDRVTRLEKETYDIAGVLHRLWTTMQSAGALPNPTQAPASPTPWPTPTALPSGPSLAVNCGGPAYVDKDGFTWAADQPYTPGSWGYNGGSASSSTVAIAGTQDQALYQSERYNMTSYQFDVPSGLYRIELGFAEIYQYASANQRIFDVVIEGTPVISGLDLYVDAGPYTAYNRSFEVPITDGQATIEFIARKGAAKISSIRVSPVTPTGPPPTPSLQQRVSGLEDHMTQLESLLQQILGVFDKFLGM